MANMSYVRFENTVRDLADCMDHIYDDLEEREAAARVRMIRLAMEIVQSAFEVSGLVEDLDREEANNLFCALGVEFDLFDD